MSAEVIPNTHSVLAVTKCSYCSQFRPTSETRFIGSIVPQCLPCQHKHVANAMQFTPPQACQMCNRSTVELAALAGDDFRMAVHYADGIYQAFCMECDAKYVQLRKDLYANTPFGHERKL